MAILIEAQSVEYDEESFIGRLKFMLESELSSLDKKNYPPISNNLIGEERGEPSHLNQRLGVFAAAAAACICHSHFGAFLSLSANNHGD